MEHPNMIRTIAPATLAAFIATMGSAMAERPAGEIVSQSRIVLEADGHGVRGQAWQDPTPTATLGAEFGVDMIPAPAVMVPDMDHQMFFDEDEAAGSGKLGTPLRFAVPVGVELTVGDGQWLDVPGGRLWRLEIASGAAWTARLHLTGIDLADGQQLRLSNPGAEDSVVGPIEGVGQFGDGSAWGMAMPTNRTLIEWFVPHGTPADALPFGGVDYYYGYRDIWAAMRQEFEGGVAVGSCHLDPICFPTWSDESNGTVRLIFSGFLCSGQLTATTAADETPYVSTANHCIATQTIANSCQFNFFYRRNTCASSASTSAGTNITGGDLVRTYAPSDCTLLMVRPTLPSTVRWVGWTNANVGTSTASTCLHHPDGSYQRISFGTKDATSFNCGSPQSNYSRALWGSATQYGVTTIGVTEGGSSGSAFYRNSDKKMFGVLTCGASACSNTSGRDGYGRWDVAVNTSSSGFATSLAAGTDDTLEDNDTCATARAIGPASYSGLVVKRLDEDWYRLSVPVGAQVSVSMTYTHSNGDIDAQLFSACGGSVLLDRTGNVNNEAFNYTNNTGSTELLLRVYLSNDTRNEYSLTYSVSAPAPANDNCSGATAIGAGNVAFSTVGATDSLPALPAGCNASGTTIGKDVWYRFTAPCSGTVDASTCGAGFDTTMAIYPGTSCPSGTAVTACSDNACGSGSAASWTVTAGSTWYIRIGSPTSASGSGTLSVSCAAPPCAGDINGDNGVDGIDLGLMLGQWGGSGTADLNGDNLVDGLDLGVLLGAWGGCP
jgi:hypothetical protein